MSDNKVTISVLGKLDAVKTKAAIAKQLSDIGKISKINFKVDTASINKAQVATEKELLSIALRRAEVDKLSNKSAIESANVFKSKMESEYATKIKLAKSFEKVEAQRRASEKQNSDLIEKDTSDRIAKEKSLIKTRQAGYTKIAKYINDMNNKMLLMKKNSPYGDTSLLDKYNKKLSDLRINMQLGKFSDDDIAKLKTSLESLDREYARASQSFKESNKQTATSLSEVEKQTNDLRNADEEYWNGRFENQLKDRTTTNDTLKQMKTYYSGIETEQKKEQSSVDTLNIKKQKLIKKGIKANFKASLKG